MNFECITNVFRSARIAFTSPSTPWATDDLDIDINEFTQSGDENEVEDEDNHDPGDAPVIP